MRISYHDADFNVASWEEFDDAKRAEEAELDAMVREEEARDPQNAKSRAFRAQIKAQRDAIAEERRLMANHRLPHLNNPQSIADGHRHIRRHSEPSSSRQIAPATTSAMAPDLLQAREAKKARAKAKKDRQKARRRNSKSVGASSAGPRTESPFPSDEESTSKVAAWQMDVQQSSSPYLAPSDPPPFDMDDLPGPSFVNTIKPRRRSLPLPPKIMFNRQGKPALKQPPRSYASHSVALLWPEGASTINVPLSSLVDSTSTPIISIIGTRPDIEQDNSATIATPKPDPETTVKCADPNWEDGTGDELSHLMTRRLNVRTCT